MDSNIDNDMILNYWIEDMALTGLKIVILFKAE